MTVVKTYYSSRSADIPPRLALEGEIDADICVVGAGLAGLTTALELVRGGRSVVVLDAETVGHGASGRNGGFVGPGWSQRLDVLEQMLGADSADALYRLSLEGVSIVANNIAVLEIPDIDVATGKLSCARTPSRDAFLTRRDRLQGKFGQRVAVWETERVRSVLRTSRYFEALHYPDDFQINPLAYSHGLAREIERLGGRIFEESRVTATDRVLGGRILTTKKGRIKARHVVMATGGYTEPWVKPLHRAHIPIATYVMLTQAHPELVDSAIRTPFAVGDQRRAGDYYRLVDGGDRILWGGRITTRVSEPRRLAEMMRRTMVATFPQLEPLDIDFAWSGRMAYARHRMPQVGPIEDGLWSCTAFGGHGLNTTAIGGKVLAEAILNHTDRWRMFAPFGFVWAGGLAGRVAAQTTYWWLQGRDALTEALSRSADTGA